MTTLQTRLGTIAGVRARGATAFLGIPYAAPPLGERRWKAPVPAALWTGTFDVAFTFNAFKDGDLQIAFHDGEDPVIRELADRWSQTLCAFARTGDPGDAALGPWPRYEPDSRACLVVEPTPRIALDPDGPELRAVYGVG